jgi:hypothetical protein
VTDRNSLARESERDEIDWLVNCAIAMAMNLSTTTEHETLGANEVYDYGGNMIVATTTKVIGCWTKIEVPLEGGFDARFQPVLRATKNEDGETSTITLDIEGAHSMQYTPWKLLNKTMDTKIWIHDEALIAERNKNEEEWKLKEALREVMESASDASFEHAEGE